MANCLTIMVTEFRTKARFTDEPVIEYGYVAYDQYAQTFEMAHESMESFYKKYPTEQSLIDHVLSNDDEFNDFYNDDGGIEVVGFDNPTEPK